MNPRGYHHGIPTAVWRVPFSGSAAPVLVGGLVSHCRGGGLGLLGGVGRCRMRDRNHPCQTLVQRIQLLEVHTESRH